MMKFRKKYVEKSKFLNTKEAIDINHIIIENILASNKYDVGGKSFNCFVRLWVSF